jgi:hypothetical protein
MPQVAPLIGNIALNLAIGAGASLLANLFRPQRQAVSTQGVDTTRGLSFEVEVGESTAVRAILGLGRATGRLAYVNEFGTDNEYVQMVIDIGHGWHDGLEHFLVDEQPVALAGSNADPFGHSVVPYTVSGTPYLWVKYYTGAPGQAADAKLVEHANPAGRWTAAHTFTGVAYLIITCRYNADLFGSAIPRFGSVWRGLRLFDWRVPGAVWGVQSTYVFTKNSAVIRYNFRRGIYVNGVRVLGQGFASFACDLAGYTAAANRCDELYYDPVSDSSFPIFEFGRQVSDDEEKLSVLRELDASYCGSSFKRGGADVPLPAQQLVSVMTLADIDRLGGEPIRVDRKGVVSQKKTMWHGQFVSQSSGWAEAPFTPRIAEDLESVLGGRRSVAMNQPYESSQERAQLRAEIALRRQFYPATRKETFSPRALVLEPGDPVIRDCEWGPTLMVVEASERHMKDGAVVGVTLTLSQWDNAIVPASGDSFVTLPPAVGPGNADPNRTIAVSGFGMIAYQQSGGGAVHPHGKASWTQITDPSVDQVMIRVWPSAGTEANDKQDFFASARLQSNRVCGPLQPGTAYKAKAIPLRADGRTCVWTNETEFTTGPQEMPLADGSVTPEKLGQELQNERGMLVGAGTGTLADRLVELEERIAQAETAAVSTQATAQERYDLLKAQNGRALAAIVVSRRLITELNAAFAQFQVEVAAQLDQVMAGGLLRIESQVDPETATATIMFKVRAQAGDTFGEAVLQLGAEADLLGGTADSWIGAMADRFYFLATNGDIVTQPFAVQADFVKITELRFENLKSIDGETIVIRGTAGDAFASFGVD